MSQYYNGAAPPCNDCDATPGGRGRYWRDVSHEAAGHILASFVQRETLGHTKCRGRHLPVLVIEAIGWGWDHDGRGAGGPVYLICGQGTPLRMPAMARPIELANGRRGFLVVGMEGGAWIVDAESGGYRPCHRPRQVWRHGEECPFGRKRGAR